MDHCLYFILNLEYDLFVNIDKVTMKFCCHELWLSLVSPNLWHGQVIMLFCDEIDGSEIFREKKLSAVAIDAKLLILYYIIKTQHGNSLLHNHSLIYFFFIFRDFQSIIELCSKDEPATVEWSCQTMWNSQWWCFWNM